MRQLFRYLLPAVVLFGLAGTIPAVEPMKTAFPGADAAGKPELTGPDSDSYMIEFNVSNVPQGTAVLWDVTPDENGVKMRVVKTEKAILIAGPPGQYKLKVRLIKGEDVTEVKKTFTLTGGKDPPNPPNPPGPGPLPPVPTPTPGQVSYFVVVEDTSKAGAWRGDILGSPKVAAFYKTLQAGRTEPIHRLISIHGVGPDGVDTPEVAKFKKLAEGKDLPLLFLLDKDRKVINGEGVKAPIESPDAFIAAITPTVPHKRAMGNLDKPRKLKFKMFGDAPNVPLIPRDQWKEVDLSTFLPAVKDQDGVGACNAFATISAFEGARAEAGLPYVKLSPGYLYGNINGGQDEGSMLEDGLAWMMENGTCLASTVGELDWRTGRRRPAAAVAESKNYKVIEAYECPNFDAIASAVQQGFQIIEGLMWYDNFTPDRDGWLPTGGRGQPGGHALHGYGLAKRNGVWGMRTRNSWTAQWGVGGNCIIPEPLFGRGVGGFWAIRAVTQTPTGFSNVSKKPLLPSLDRNFALAF